MSKYDFTTLSFDDQQVEQARREHGINELPVPEVESFFDKLKENFDDPLIKILLVALGITLGLAAFGYAEWIEGFGIAVAVFLATFVATFSEFKNEEAFQKLQEEASRAKNMVFRNGAAVSLFSGEIVVGDHVLLQAGDKIPADGPLVLGELSCNLFAVTGESLPQRKFAVVDDYRVGNVENYDENEFLLRGSIIEEGEGILLVAKVGTSTTFGSMIKEIVENDERESPLEVKLEKLADNISTIGYIGALFIALSFMFKQIVMDQHYSLPLILDYLVQWQLVLKDCVTALILSIIIIVVAVPEGLPMMIAIVLSLNMRRLLKDKVLVRKLLGIETAGSLNILFSDKTGTITAGVLKPHVYLTGDLTHHASYQKLPKSFQSIVRFLIKNSSQSYIDNDGNINGGNSTERAFLTFVDDMDYLQKRDNITRLSENLFNSTNKFSSSLIEINDQKLIDSLGLTSNRITLIKGAPEKLLMNCHYYISDSGNRTSIKNTGLIEQEITDLSSQGIRVIAIGYSHQEMDQSGTLPDDLVFVGAVGLQDEIRPESKGAIRMAEDAGIQVVMVTGDRLETAVAIAEEVGLLEKYTRSEYNESELLKHYGNSVISSAVLNSMDDDELVKIIPELRVIARALPSDKSRLVQVSQSLNLVVGMTGDGVNDTAALHIADVGFGMGSGTSMAKEASDIVILDDNFSSILKSVLYGRTIFKSIRKFIIFQSTINLASTLIVFLGPFMGFDFPLTLIQLLWVNLVMDTLAAIAFGGEPSLGRYMQENPVSRSENIISPYMWSSIIFGGVLISILSGVFLVNDSVFALFDNDNSVFLTAFFSFFIFITSINAFNVRTTKINLFENITRNVNFFSVLMVIFSTQIVFTYIGGKYLRTVPLGIFEWVLVIGAALIIIPFDILRKMFIVPMFPASWRE
jgi:calcium-translocating P-type ATPase